MRLPRASGILLHPTSLPGRFGIGDLGPSAASFASFLRETGQRWWQILPIGPTGFGNSPYQSHSSYAGNRLLLSPERLVEDGFLSMADLDDYPACPDSHVDFDLVADAKDRLLKVAFDRFRGDHPEFDAFRAGAAHWLGDYALYMALKEAHGGRAWVDWEPGVATREASAISRARADLAPLIAYYEFVQFLFHRQWEALRARCRSVDVQLIGDVPIFVAQDSADVWANPHLFKLGPDGRPTAVAGVPPDYFSADGQLWGNPLYDWEAHAAEGFAWWIARMRSSTDRVDLVRLDHFRGFEAYWEVPADAPTAAFGHWSLGPGSAFLDALRAGLGGLPLIAEDLGKITVEVEALRDRFELPGMRILQFAFGDDPKADDYLPYKHIPHCVVYTGTHDNDTTLGWYDVKDGSTTQSREVIDAERSFVRRYLGCAADDVLWGMIRLAMGSVADTTILPMQDLLGLGSEARMNTPGRAVGNWSWRYRAGDLTAKVRDRLADVTATFNRWNGEVTSRWQTPTPKPEDASVLLR